MRGLFSGFALLKHVCVDSDDVQQNFQLLHAFEIGKVIGGKLLRWADARLRMLSISALRLNDYFVSGLDISWLLNVSLWFNDWVQENGWISVNVKIDWKVKQIFWFEMFANLVPLVLNILW